LLLTEADTCRRYVLPKLREADWTDDQIREQKYFTDGRIVVTGRRHFRKPGKKADYLLYFRPDYRLAVVEAAVGGRLLLGRRYYRILDGCWLPLPTEAMRLMAFKNALALASMLSVETPWPRYSSP